MDENLGMKKFETASSNDLITVMNCVVRCSARNCSNGLLVQVRLRALISIVSCAKDPALYWLMILRRGLNNTVWETLLLILMTKRLRKRLWGRQNTFFRNANSLLQELNGVILHNLMLEWKYQHSLSIRLAWCFLFSQ